MKCITSVSKKTPYFLKSLAKNVKDKAFEVLKIKEFTFVNDCFQNENNAVFGVFLQRLTNRLILLCIIISTVTIIKAQDYSIIDAHVKETPRSVEKRVESLTEYLNKHTNSDSEKVRAYYVWLASNIVYDTEAFFSNNSNKITSNSNTLKYGKAVCQGYSELFKAFCDLSNIPCFVVSGYSKGYGYSSKTEITTTDHAWNVVFVSNKWYLIDATWGAGYLNDKNRYVAELDNDYFLAKPEYFILKHLPSDPMWQLILCPISIVDYKKDNDVIVSKIKNCSTVFNYNDTIAAYLKLSPVQQQMKSAERAFKFNPSNIEEPGFALLNVAYNMSSQLAVAYEKEEYTKALYLNKEILDINQKAFNYLKKSKSQQGKNGANICKQNISSSKENIKSLESFLK